MGESDPSLSQVFPSAASHKPLFRQPGGYAGAPQAGSAAGMKDTRPLLR